MVQTDAEGNAVVDETNTLFFLLDDLPAAGLVIGVAILIVVLFFVTSSDSGSLVVDMLASGGNVEPPVWSRVLWAVLEGAVAVALVLAGGLTALRGVAISIALPFSIVMIVMCFALVRQFRVERHKTLQAELQMRREQFTAHVAQTLQEDGLLEDVSTPESRPPRRRRRRT